MTRYFFGEIIAKDAATQAYGEKIVKHTMAACVSLVMGREKKKHASTTLSSMPLSNNAIART